MSDEIDALFDGATVEDSGPVEAGRVPSTADSRREIRRLFGEIAVHHTAQLREFLVELSSSATSKRWAEICAPALSSIRRAADAIAYDPMTRALKRLEKSLDDARRGADTMIDGPHRDKLLDAFKAVQNVLPEAFDIKAHRALRDPIIVNTLLEQVAGMTTLSRDRIYGAGVTTLSAFYASTPSELAQTTGVQNAVCGRVIDRFAEYRKARTEDAAHADHDAERQQLGKMLAQLRVLQTEFRQAEVKEDGREKRRVRSERANLLRAVDLSLAHLGEVKLIDEITRIPVDAKIERVGRYIRQPSDG